jgi:ribA/ribD-fused uncharacterized protein
MPTYSQRLIHAVRKRKYDRLRQLLREHEGVSARSLAGRTALHAAAEEGDRESARVLLEAGADVNARMNDGQTPLHLAAGNGGFTDLADKDVDRRDPCKRGHRMDIKVAEVVANIIKEKAPDILSDLNPLDTIPEENKADIFSAAIECFSNPSDLYKEIIGRGIDLDRVDPDFSEQLRGKPRFFSLVEFLLGRQADVNAVDKHGSSVLRIAVELGRKDTVELLLGRGADPNQAGLNGELVDLISIALERSRVEIADALLAHGAKFDPKASGPIHEAAGNGREKVVLWLLERGADINVHDDQRNTPLLTAAYSGHAPIVDMLLKRGADATARNETGDSLLHAAASWPDCMEMVRHLGFHAETANSCGRTAVHVAALCVDAESVQEFLDGGASANTKDNDGNTPLHVIFFGDECRPDIEFPVFLALVSAGADRSARNNDGKTAFDVAQEFGYPEEYLKLLDARANVEAKEFLWLGEDCHIDFLPKGMVSFELNGAVWPSAEHYLNAQKVDDGEARERIREAPTVEAAVSRFRDLKIKPPANWHNRCDEVMCSALLAKFRQNDALREQLLATGTATLVSDSNCDSYWYERPGVEFNAIGKMLMRVRFELSAEGGNS